MKIVSQAKGRLPKVPGTKRWEFENGILILNLESVPDLRLSFSSLKDMEDYWDSLYKLYENEKEDVVCLSRLNLSMLF
jgi:hypothetical protein